MLQDYDCEFRQFCEHILEIRDSYTEFIIEPGSGGMIKYAALLLGTFFNYDETKSKKPELWEENIIYREKKWKNIPNKDIFIGYLNRPFGDFIFYDECICKKSYTGNIKFIISNTVGSASFDLCLYFLLIHGNMLIKKNTITSNKKSKVKFIGKSAMNRVSNCFAGDSGGGMFFDLDGVSFKRTGNIINNYKSNFLVGRIT